MITRVDEIRVMLGNVNRIYLKNEKHCQLAFQKGNKTTGITHKIIFVHANGKTSELYRTKELKQLSAFLDGYYLGMQKP